MQHKSKFILLLLGILISSLSGFGQNVSGVDVKSLPDSEIEKAQKAMKDAGLSTQDAANIARQKGATEQQIQDFQNRSQWDTTSHSVINGPVQEASEMFEEQQDIENSKRSVPFKTTGKIFGSYLFNSKNLTFDPSLTIQTPKSYEIGIGDQIIVNIWGNSQNNYQLVVNLNGQVTIPDVGPIYIAGLTFDDAENKIKQRLTSIYADMGGDNPQTFAQVNMGQLRSIQVNIVGDAASPGTYTLPVTATAFNALYVSGGPGDIGSFRNIKVIRNNKLFKTVDIYKFLVDADPSDNILLKDQDILFIPPVEKRVNTTGEFKRKALFEMKEGENLDQLIRFAGGFTDNSFLSSLQIYRKNQRGFQIIDVPLTEKTNTILQNGDEIRNGEILNRFENRVTISGSVFRPGEYEWHESMTLFDLIIKADSLRPYAFKNRGIITRLNPDHSKNNIAFNVDEIISKKTTLQLQPEDIVIIKSHFALTEDPYIIVNGEIQEPGKFEYADNITLNDAIFLAGGFTEAADSTFIEVSRRLSYEEAAELTDDLVHIFVKNMSRNLQSSSEDANFVLQPFDQVSVRRAPGFRQQGSVLISGEVKYAGAFAISDKKQRISDLINLAGGITPQAFSKGATLYRSTAELGTEQISINLQEILNNPGSETDLFLYDGDRLNIPQFMQTVKISGNVQNPFSHTFESGKNAKYYIDLSGGFNDDAKKKKVYVQHANGTTAITKGFIFKSYPRVQPGSLVVVPQKPEKKGDGKWLAIASTMATLGLTIATIVNLTK